MSFQNDISKLALNGWSSMPTYSCLMECEKRNMFGMCNRGMIAAFSKYEKKDKRVAMADSGAWHKNKTNIFITIITTNSSKNNCPKAKYRRYEREEQCRKRYDMNVERFWSASCLWNHWCKYIMMREKIEETEKAWKWRSQLTSFRTVMNKTLYWFIQTLLQNCVPTKTLSVTNALFLLYFSIQSNTFILANNIQGQNKPTQ